MTSRPFTPPEESTAAPPAAVTFAQAFGLWLKMGFLSFGGPAGQIALMHHELVDKKRWISEKRFLHALNYCMVLPGPEAQQLATYLGWLMHRTWGGVVAGGLFVLPSLLILMALAWVYLAFGHTPLVAGLFYGIKPAVTALVFQAAHRMGSRTLKTPALWIVALASFVGTVALNVPFPYIVLAAALFGWLCAHYKPQWFAVGGGHKAQQAKAMPALIDDHTPTPPHALFSAKRFAAVLVVGLLLWAVPLGAMTLAWGWPHAMTQMGWFFTKAALLTFGGAYAVLPYVFDGAVETHGWLTAAQMMDGLALGETTPGPLIMIVAFVGFVGAGVLGACVATWFTFLPSFVFIFLGAPLIETTHQQPRLTAPLTAITAAVVGVILNLALFFGVHTLWPQGFEWPLSWPVLWSLDWPAAGIAVGALIALVRYQRNVLEVIAVCALLGLLTHTALGAS